MTNKDCEQILVNFWRGPKESHVIIDIRTGKQQPIKKVSRAKPSPDFKFIMTSKGNKFVLEDITSKLGLDNEDAEDDENAETTQEKAPIHLIDGDILRLANNLQYRGFTPDSQYCFFNTSNGYQFVRMFDESPVCTLPMGYLMIVNSESNSYVLKGVIDKDSRKYYKWNEDLMDIKVNS
jgi:hypothetical protein